MLPAVRVILGAVMTFLVSLAWVARALDGLGDPRGES